MLQLRALDKKSTKFEKLKNERCGSHAWDSDVAQLAALIREGKTTWEDLALDDIDVRLKWAGLFHRRKRTPGRFMMRLKASPSRTGGEGAVWWSCFLAVAGALLRRPLHQPGSPLPHPAPRHDTPTRPLARLPTRRRCPTASSRWRSCATWGT